MLSPDAPTRTVPDTEFEIAIHKGDHAIRLMLLLTREAALRSATAYNLTPRNIVGPNIVTVTKNHGAVCIPMSPRIAALVALAIIDCPATTPLMCQLGLRDHADMRNALRHRLHVLQERHGLGDWSWHDLRRTAAQRLYQATGSLNAVQRLLGHTSLMSTLHYLNAKIAPISAGHIAQLSPISGGESEN